MDRKISRHDQEIAYFLYKQEGKSQKKLADFYGVSPAAMSGYMKEMGHVARESALLRALGNACRSSDNTSSLPEPIIYLDNPEDDS